MHVGQADLETLAEKHERHTDENKYLRRLAILYEDADNYRGHLECGTEGGRQPWRRKRMADNVRTWLSSSEREKMDILSMYEFLGEDIGSAAVCVLQRGMSMFLQGRDSEEKGE